MMSGPAPKKQRINPLCLGGVGRPCSCDSPFWVEKHDCLKGCVCGKGRGGCQGVVCGGVGGRGGGVPCGTHWRQISGTRAESQ